MSDEITISLSREHAKTILANAEKEIALWKYPEPVADLIALRDAITAALAAPAHPLDAIIDAERDRRKNMTVDPE